MLQLHDKFPTYFSTTFRFHVVVKEEQKSALSKHGTLQNINVGTGIVWSRSIGRNDFEIKIEQKKTLSPICR